MVWLPALVLLAACTSALRDDTTSSGPVPHDDTAPSGDTGAPDTGAHPCDTVPAGVDLDQVDAGFLFTDGAVAPTVVAFCIGLDEAAVAALSVDPEVYTEGTLTFGGETWTVAVRLKGSAAGSFRTLDEKASFKVKLDAYDPDQRFYGRKRLTFNNMIQDGAMLSEHVSYYLFAEAGVPSPRHGYANVYVNGTLYGLYGVVEPMDEELLDRLFPDAPDGNLYEGGYGADLYAGREATFAVQESAVDPPDTSDLHALVDAVEAAAASGDALGLLDAWFDRDALLALWAVELVTGDADAYTTAANNYQIYHPTDASPWGIHSPDRIFPAAWPRVRLWGGVPDVPSRHDRALERARHRPSAFWTVDPRVCGPTRCEREDACLVADEVEARPGVAALC